MKIIIAACSLVFATTSYATAAGFELLKPHRAVYDISLKEAEERSGIKGMSGRIVYEMTGNECIGVTVKYRFVAKMNTSRDTFVTDQRTNTYETPDGNEISFLTKSFVNDMPDQDVVGNAKRTEDGLKVSFGLDKEREKLLEDAIFTNMHTARVLEQAKQGVSFKDYTLFDGAGEADRTLSNATIVGEVKTYGEIFEKEKPEAVEELLSQEAWPVSSSYFSSEQDNTGEALPEYETSLLLYPGGITRQMTMQYKDYSLLAALQELEFLEEEACE